MTTDRAGPARTRGCQGPGSALATGTCDAYRPHYAHYASTSTQAWNKAVEPTCTWVADLSVCRDAWSRLRLDQHSD
jgi:hypothetical protein